MLAQAKTLFNFSLWPEHRALLWHAAQCIANKYLFDITWVSPVRPDATSPDVLARMRPDIDPRPLAFYIEGFELAYGLERYNVFFRWRNKTSDGQVVLSPGVDGVVQFTVWKKEDVFGIVEASAHAMMLGSNWQEDPDLRFERSALAAQGREQNWAIPIWENGIEGELLYVTSPAQPRGRIISNRASTRVGETILKRWQFWGMDQYVTAQKAAQAQKALLRSEAALVQSERQISGAESAS